METFEREIKLQCTALALHPQEIKNNIPINVLNEIKNKYSQPYFRAYSIAHEGIATPRFIDDNNTDTKSTKWGRKVIQSIQGVLKKGVQFFVGHNSDNSTEGRKPIGEIVATFQKNINHKLHHIAIGLFPDKLEAGKYDVCSLEGDVTGKDYEDISVIESVKNITGIALGNSAYDKPAFPGAVYLGAIQAFGDIAVVDPPTPKIKSEEITMTFEEIKKAVKELNIFPAQLYTEDDLKQDRVYGKLFDQIKTATEAETTLKTQLADKDTEIKTLQKDIALTGSKEKLTKLFPEGLTDSQKTFIEKKFTPETVEDLADEKIKVFIDDSLKDYSEFASIFNNGKPVPPPEDPAGNKEDEEDDIDKIVNEVSKTPQGE